MENNISVSELRNLATSFFDYLENVMKVDKVNVGEDYYWSTLCPEKYNMDQQPEKLGVGQLSEDLQFLREILKNKEFAVAPNLVHFSAVLEYISHNVHFKKNE